MGVCLAVCVLGVRNGNWIWNALNVTIRRIRRSSYDCCCCLCFHCWVTRQIISKWIHSTTIGVIFVLFLLDSDMALRFPNEKMLQKLAKHLLLQLIAFKITNLNFGRPLKFKQSLKRIITFVIQKHAKYTFYKKK